MEIHRFLLKRALPVLGHTMLHYDYVVSFSIFITSLDTSEFKVKDFPTLIDCIFYSVKGVILSIL